MIKQSPNTSNDGNMKSLMATAMREAIEDKTGSLPKDNCKSRASLRDETIFDDKELQCPPNNFAKLNTVELIPSAYAQKVALQIGSVLPKVASQSKAIQSPTNLVHVDYRSALTTVVQIPPES
eukprot:3478002-Amphidinium_carterae.6